MGAGKHLILYAGVGFLGTTGDNDAFTYDSVMAKVQAAVIGASQLDTVILAFLHCTSDGTDFEFYFHGSPIGVLDPAIPFLNDLRNGTYGPPKKILISLRGNKNDAKGHDSSAITQDPEGFAKAFATLCGKYPFDGLDLDCEGIAPAVLLPVAQQFKKALPNAILTASPERISPTDWGTMLGSAKNPNGPGNLFDWLNVQFYSYIASFDDWPSIFDKWSAAIPAGAGVVASDAFLVAGWYAADFNDEDDPANLSHQVPSVRSKDYFGGTFVFSYGDVLATHKSLADWVNAMQGTYVS